MIRRKTAGRYAASYHALKDIDKVALTRCPFAISALGSTRLFAVCLISDKQSDENMAAYTNEQYLEMLLAYGECQRNGRAAARLYAQRFPDARHPEHAVIQGVVLRLLETGKVQPDKAKPRRQTATDEFHEVEVVAHVELNPHVSTRAIARDAAISHSSVSRILKRLEYHPYHVYVAQNLHEQDDQRRRVFCAWIQNTLQVDERFLEYVCTTDEANFSRDGVVNRHNMHYWATENPYWVRPGHFQVKFSVNVWCAIIGNRILGPVFLPGTLTGPMFLQFLTTTFTDLLDDLPLDVLRSMWLQLDGAPGHYSRDVRTWLDNNFHDRWIGRAGPVAWPPRSPDLSPLDFFLWGHVKQLVYATPVNSVEELKERIRFACASVTPEMLTAVRENWKQRFQVCLQQDGGLIEHILR